MKKRKMVAVLTSFAVAASFCITSLGSVSTPATADAAPSSTTRQENGKKENLVEAIRQDVELEEGVNIEIPMDLSFSIDPIDLMEKGQIQSKEYTFKNNSDRDVRITFSEIYYTFSNEEDFRSLDSLEELNPYSTTKDIFLYLENVSPKVKLETLDSQELEVTDENFDPNIEETENTEEEMDIDNYYQLEEQKVVITDEMQYDACSFVLSGNKNSSKNKITFRLNGAVTEFPEEPWEDSDIEIHVSYDCIFEEKEDEIPQSVSAIEKEAVEGAVAESGSINETADSQKGKEDLKENADSSKEDSIQDEGNKTEKESETSDGSHTTEDKKPADDKTENKGDTGGKQEEQDSTQKEDVSDKEEGGNHSGNEDTGNSDTEKNGSSDNSSGKGDSSSNNDTSEKKDNSEDSSSEKTDSGKDNLSNGQTE